MNPEHIIGFVIIILVVLLKDRLSQRQNAKIEVSVIERLASLEARMRTQESREIPPPWFKEQVDAIKHAVDRLCETCPNSMMLPRNRQGNE